MENNTDSSVPIYHKLHLDILKVMTDYLDGLKSKHLNEDSLYLHIQVLMKWSKSKSFEFVEVIYISYLYSLCNFKIY